MKNLKIMLCPQCGTELHVTNQREVKCKCLTKLAVLGSGRDRQLIKLNEVAAAKKARRVRCRDCLSCRNGDCVDIDKPRRYVDKDCLRVCKRFVGYQRR